MVKTPDLPGVTPVVREFRCNNAIIASSLLMGPHYPTTLGAVTFVGKVIEDGEFFQATIFSFYPDTFKNLRLNSKVTSPFPVHTSFSLGGETYSFQGGGVKDINGAILNSIEPTGSLSWGQKGWWTFSTILLQPVGSLGPGGQENVYAANYSLALHAEPWKGGDTIVTVISLRPDVLLVAETWPAPFDGTSLFARYIRIGEPVFPPSDPNKKGLSVSQTRGRNVIVEIDTKRKLKVPLSPSQPITNEGLPPVLADIPMTVLSPHYLCGTYEVLNDHSSPSREDWLEALKERGGYG